MQNNGLNRVTCLMRATVLMIFFAPAVWGVSALKINPNAPIQIQSDNALLDQKSGQLIYQGTVIMTQGQNTLLSDKLTVKRDTRGSFEVILATGSPAKFDAIFENDPQPIHATAKTIYYYPEKQLLVLEGSATLDHEQDKFKGPLLRYELDKKVVSASSLNNQRPVITLYPRGVPKS